MKIMRLKKLFITSLLLLVVQSFPAVVQQSLLEAVIGVDLAGVEKAVAAGANVNAKDNKGGTALIYACLQVNLPIIKFLLNNNADPNIRSDKELTPLLALTMTSGQEKSPVEEVFQKEKHSDFIEAARLLIAAGANVNERGGIYGETPLMRAVRKDDEPMARLLFDSGADPNIPESEGAEDFEGFNLTPLILAVKDENYPMTGLLLANGADVNKSDANRKTPLMYAIDNIDTTIVALLLDYHANVNVQDESDETPLIMAVQIAKDNNVRNNVLERRAILWIIERLLKNGADPNIASDEGTALDIVGKSGDDDIIALFKPAFAERKKAVAEKISETRGTPTDISKLISEFETGIEE